MRSAGELLFTELDRLPKGKTAMPIRNASSSESLLISSILRNQDMPVATRTGLQPEMFYGYEDEWEWLTRFYMKNRKVPSKLVFKKQFPGFAIRNVDDTEYLAGEVKKMHAQRQLIAHAKQISRSLAEGDVAGAVSTAYANILSIASQIGTYSDGDIFRDNADVLEELERTMDRVSETGNAGIPIGFPTLDGRTGGAKPGELITVGARLGVGKSWVLTKWAVSAANAGYTVQYDSLEMSRSQVAYRVYSLLADQGEELFRNTDLMKGTGFDRRAFGVFLSRLKKKVTGNLHLSDKSRGKVTPLTIAAQIERNKPDIVFVDYITLLSMPGGGIKDWASIGELTGELKGLAMQYGIPIVGAAQLNRERGIGKRGEPAGPEALAGSDMIGQDSDTVITVAPVSESVLAMKCPKNRYGQSNFKWYTEFRPGDGIFREVTHTRSLELADEDAERAALLEDQMQ